MIKYYKVTVFSNTHRIQLLYWTKKIQVNRYELLTHYLLDYFKAQQPIDEYFSIYSLMTKMSAPCTSDKIGIINFNGIYIVAAGRKYESMIIKFGKR